MSQPVKPVVINLVVTIKSVTVLEIYLLGTNNGLIIAGSIPFHQELQWINTAGYIIEAEINGRIGGEAK